MRSRLWIACLAALLASRVAAGQEKAKTGTIQGVVRFTGEVPPAKQLPTGDGGTVEHYDMVVDAKTKGLRWVVAVLEDAPEQPKLTDDATPVVIDQKDMLYVPRVIAVQHGRPITFDNSDPFNHSVSIFSSVKENELNVFVTKKDPVTKAFVAEKAPIRVGCVLHPAMTAWIHVAPHPWVAVTDAKGAFTIKDVPPGKYKLWLKHPDTRVEERREVEVRAGQKAEVAFEWKESKPKRDKK
jgi:plastocyanin